MEKKKLNKRELTLLKEVSALEDGMVVVAEAQAKLGSQIISRKRVLWRGIEERLGLDKTKRHNVHLSTGEVQDV